MTEPATRGLDPAWVAQQIGAREVHFDGFIGTGQIGRNARFRVGGHAEHATVVVKLPAEDPGVRELGFDQGLYPKECTFYRSLVGLVDVCTPRVLAVDIDADALDFALVLEDMAGSEPGDQFREATDAELDLAVGQAAALHGPLWGADHPALDELRDDATDRPELADLLAMLLPMCLDRLAGRLDPHTTPALQRFLELSDIWAAQAPQTAGLVHSDFRPDNFLFGRGDDAPPLAIVDWQTVAIGASVNDIAYLLGAAVDPGRRRDIEHAHLASYRDRLRDYGVDYDAAVCWDEYTLGSCHGAIVGVLATIMASETKRGNELFALMLNRHAQHMLDVGALDRLADLA